MKLKSKLFLIILCLFILGLLYVSFNEKQDNNKVNKYYKVYLNGENIGNIDDKDILFALIDEKQQSIKDKYNVKNVYPPHGLDVIKYNTYSNQIDSIESIYQKIENSDEFTVLGYEIKISKTENRDEYSIYVLDKNVFVDALKKFVMAFIDESKYNEYINGTQGDLEDVKLVYEEMGFDEDIIITEKRVSTKANIYTNSDELAQDLLFGFNHKEENYVIKTGDTIDSISEEHKLNPQEFLIANPSYSSKDSLLRLGDKVNVTLINPELSFTYKVSEIKEEEQAYSKEIKRDDNQPSTYSEITQVGITGLTIQYTNYSVTNGEKSSAVQIDESKSRVIREPVTEITTKGRKASGGGVYGKEIFIDTGSGWRWPTSNPYTISSEFAWRWGKHHNGMDITGAGLGSNIYAANDGTVVYVNKSCPNDGGSSLANTCGGGGYGNYVIIDHGDDLFTIYGHMLNNIPVYVGQQVSRGTVIGHMGNSGKTTGYHLHFGFSVGYPGRGTWYNPRELYK